ncbi:MAG: metallophosphoesterase [Syntrophobacteraceae bacterium]
MGEPDDFAGGASKEVVRVAATSDLHCGRGPRGRLRPVFAEIAERADILVLCGDLTHFGSEEGIDVFLHEVAPALGKVPVLSVLGNHDFESGKRDEFWSKLCDAGIIMLDGNDLEIRGIGFTGVKGFGGGFGDFAVQPLGELSVKNFVKETVDEADKLDAGLARLGPGPRIALLHYSPIRDTIAGEPPELFPFLGSSRLEEPLDRHAVTAAFHGHAHGGHYRGKTRGDAPVYNVSAAVLKRCFPDRPPYLMLEVPVMG